MQCKTIKYLIHAKIVFQSETLHPVALPKRCNITLFNRTYTPPNQNTINKKQQLLHFRSQYARINTRLFSFVCTGPILWNRLPNTLKNTYTLASFKRNLKRHLNASSLVG